MFTLCCLRNESGNHLPMAVSIGDKVLLPEFGGAKVNRGIEVSMVKFSFIRVGRNLLNK